MRARLNRPTFCRGVAPGIACERPNRHVAQRVMHKQYVEGQTLEEVSPVTAYTYIHVNCTYIHILSHPYTYTYHTSLSHPYTYKKKNTQKNARSVCPSSLGVDPEKDTAFRERVIKGGGVRDLVGILAWGNGLG